jgi:glucan 1,3-beta-glucosidase
MWLNGFNDQLPTYPRVKCGMVKCSDVEPYMGRGMQPGAPPDELKGMQDPFGSGGYSSPVFGYCPVGALFEDGEDRAMVRMTI